MFSYGNNMQMYVRLFSIEQETPYIKIIIWTGLRVTRIEEIMFCIS
jgi:hypothetical protein